MHEIVEVDLKAFNVVWCVSTDIDSPEHIIL